MEDGEDCATALAGKWNSVTETCTLTTDVTGGIQILGDGITLDGAGHAVQGSGYDLGIDLIGRSGVTVRNVTVRGFGYGIFLSSSDDNILTGNTALGNAEAGIWLQSSSDDNMISGNMVDGTMISGNGFYGINLNGAARNTIHGNTFANTSRYGIAMFAYSDENSIYNNNFMENQLSHTFILSSSGNVFHLPAPIGGNLWSDWTGPDVNGDAFVDVPYAFPGGQDDLPWTTPDGWLSQAPVVSAGENIQILSEDQAITVILGTATDADGDALDYRWMEEDTAFLDWSPVSAEGTADLDLALVPYLGTGDHTLTLEVTDGDHNVTDTMVLTIDNAPPVVQPSPSHQVVEIAVDPIRVVADTADFDGDLLAYGYWKADEELATGTIETSQGGETVALPDLLLPPGDPRFPLGTYVIEVQVADGVNAPVSASVSVEVKDSTGPSLGPVPSVTMLWPPNQELRPVTIYANAFDNGGGAIMLAVSIESSEPQDVDSDGNIIPDYYVDSVDNETGIIELLLRAERSGRGEGRTYTVTITATDERDNVSTALVKILAPHDRRKN